MEELYNPGIVFCKTTFQNIRVDFNKKLVTTQVNRLKTVRKSGKSKIHEPKANHIARFEAMFDAKICCFSAKALQLRSSGPFSLNSFSLTT
jgi:hypothetical protein